MSETNAAFEACLATCADDAVAFARMLARSDAAGDDAYQDAVIAAFTNFSKLNDHDKFKPWLFRIIVNSHRQNQRRSLWRRAVEWTDAHAVSPAQSEPFIRKALAKLRYGERHVLLLNEVFGYSTCEIAQITGLSQSGVKSRLARAKKRLQGIYAQRQSSPHTNEQVLGSTR